MAKRNKVATPAAATPAAVNPNAAANTTTTEFASETNVTEVRRQNQQSAAKAAQKNNQNM
ncbi:gamma-type small acid-soluble spore protein [Brevibacillus fulvus]|uniref:Small, acid-soluble spore protein gamma-type n=1 Tax=Brevibacillus fulvus TaxID=1125967 RepID=A0A938XW57_9BACL|nr:gamma-type small acid-soluble spore protein [Brevibacillus fulvus]MBM7591593.1 small acid-soluble spore protein E (minor gamma-type SASP) [Brevibacillus fulvus]